MRNVWTEHCWLVRARNLDGFVQDPWLQIPSLPRCLNHTHSSPTLLSKAAAHFLYSGEGREMSIIPRVGILIRCLWDRYSKTFFAFPIRFQGCINLLPRLLQCLLYVASTFPLLLLIKTMACSHTWLEFAMQERMQSKESNVVAFRIWENVWHYSSCWVVIIFFLPRHLETIGYNGWVEQTYSMSVTEL